MINVVVDIFYCERQNHNPHPDCDFIVMIKMNEGSNWPAKIWAGHFWDEFCKFDSIPIDFLHCEGWQDRSAMIFGIVKYHIQFKKYESPPRWGPTQVWIEAPEVSLQSVQERWVDGSLGFAKKLLNRQLHEVGRSEHLHLLTLVIIPTLIFMIQDECYNGLVILMIRIMVVIMGPVQPHCKWEEPPRQSSHRGKLGAGSDNH